MWQFLLNYECLQEELTTLSVVSHVLSTKVSPEKILGLDFETQEKCPFPLNRDIPSIEVTNTKIMWTYFWDQILCPPNRGVLSIEVTNTKIMWTFFWDQIVCPLNRCVPWIEVSQRRVPL